MLSRESILSLRDILKILFKRQATIVTLVLAALLTSTVVVFLMPQTFESTALILVRRSLPETEEPALASEQRGMTAFYRQVNQADEMNTAMSILKSRDLVIAVIDRLGLTQAQFDKVPDFRRYVRATWKWINEFASDLWNETKYILRLSSRPTDEEIRILKRERFIEAVANAVVIAQVTDSDVLRAGLRVSDPLLAREFANMLSEMSLAWHFEKFRQSGNLTFFGEQAEKAGQELEDLQKNLAATRLQLNMIGAEERRRLLVESRFQSNSQLNGILAKKAAVEAAMHEIGQMLRSEAAMVTLSKTTEVNPQRQQISDKLTELELRRAETAGKHDEQGRTVRDIDETLTGWRARLEKAPAKRENTLVEGINSIHQSLRQKQVDLETERAALDAEESVVRKNIEDYDNDLKMLNDNAYRVEDLERRVRTQATVYEQYLKSAELSRIAAAKQQAHMANLNIIQAAPLPVKAVKPNKWLTILLAGACGLLLGLAWAFATEMNDTSFDSPGEVAMDLAIEAFAAFPLVRSEASRRSPPSLPDETRIEAAALWSKISRSTGGAIPVIAFLSSRLGEGVTTAMLQTALAAAGRKILLIDASLDAGLTRLLHGQRQCSGLADCREEPDLYECIQSTSYPGLSLLPAGRGKKASDDLDWSRALMAMKEHHDAIFVDLGAVDASLSFPRLLAAADGAILVIAAHETRREVVARTIHELRGAGQARLLGAVLNRRRYFIPSMLYRNA